MNNPLSKQNEIQQAVTDYLHYTWIFGEGTERDKTCGTAGRDSGIEYPLDEQGRP